MAPVFSSMATGYARSKLNASDLPTEIWLLVARFIPESQMMELRTLNSLFLNCWMDLWWKQVRIDSEFPERSIYRLERVVDPFVATRTKAMSISIQSFGSFDAMDTPSSSKVIVSEHSSLLLKPKTLDPVLTLLLRSLPHLPNITTLNVELFPNAVFFLPALFHAISSSPMARTLRQLQLSGHIAMFASLMEHSSQKMPFESLAELSLILVDRQRSNPLIDNINSSHVLAPFLLSVAPTLQYLCISALSCSLDFSQLFDFLSQPNAPVPFPSLTSVAIILPSKRSLQSCPQSLHRFLHAQSETLVHLRMSLMIHEPEPLGAWFVELVDNSRPFSLQTLDIYPSSVPSGISASLELIRGTASTLSLLTIRGHYLTFEEVGQLVSALAVPLSPYSRVGLASGSKKDAKLKSLRMNITHLSVPFLHLLSHKLPQLRKLCLNVSRIVNSDQLSFCDLLRQSPIPQHLLDWKLQDLEIWQAGVKMNEVARAVASVVPSVVYGDEA